MKIFDTRSPAFASARQELDRRYEPPLDLQTKVAQILAEVRRHGDRALIRFARQFDQVTLKASQLAVAESELASAYGSASLLTRRALRDAHTNIRAFAEHSLRKSWSMKNEHGATVGERFDPFQRVGIYVPAGSAPLASTALMTATFAQAARVPEIVVCSPCRSDRSLDPTVLAALAMAGVSEIYRIGGAQAIAAMAYGTESIRPVEKIFGPGNRWVVEAKRQVFGRVAVDLLPGPSEVAVIADATANPAWIAADLLAQAEHGAESATLLLTPSTKVVAAVEREIKRQAARLSRGALLSASLAAHCWLVRTRDMDEAVELLNAYSPEHVALHTAKPRQLAQQIRTAGAIFVGGTSPVAAGDFVAGPSHELPTGGAGKSFAGLTGDQFQRRTSIVEYPLNALRRAHPSIAEFSRLEGLDAHGRSSAIRLEPTHKGR
ncbi:MAG: histidinol dehydrogenase [Verrucomicrobiia bacterium]